MRAHILLFSLLLFSSKIFSQTETDYLKISGNVVETKTDLPLSKVSVSVFKGNTLLETVLTDSAGSYKFKNLSLNETYLINFYKKKYCYKIAAIMIFDPEGTELDGTFPMDINTSLFKVGFIRKIRLRFMKTEPVAIARYDSEEDNMTWDMEYIKLMAEKIQSKGGN